MKRGLVARLATATLLVACGGAPPSAAAPSAAAPPHAHEGKDRHGHGSGHFAHRFDDAASWSKVFDDPARDAWQKPAEIVTALELQPGETVADIGAGTGYMVAHLSKTVGERGTVLALDAQDAVAAARNAENQDVDRGELDHAVTRERR